MLWQDIIYKTRFWELQVLILCQFLSWRTKAQAGVLIFPKVTLSARMEPHHNRNPRQVVWPWALTHTGCAGVPGSPCWLAGIASRPPCPPRFCVLAHPLFSPMAEYVTCHCICSALFQLGGTDFCPMAHSHKWCESLKCLSCDNLQMLWDGFTVNQMKLSTQGSCSISVSFETHRGP